MGVLLACSTELIGEAAAARSRGSEPGGVLDAGEEDPGSAGALLPEVVTAAAAGLLPSRAAPEAEAGAGSELARLPLAAVTSCSRSGGLSVRSNAEVVVCL